MSSASEGLSTTRTSVPTSLPKSEQRMRQEGSLGGHNVTPLIFDDRSKATEGRCSGCDWKAGLKTTAIALAVTAVVVGIVGLLVYLNVLELGLTNIGTMSQVTGLYTMVAGFGLAFITSILLGVSECLNRKKAQSDEEESLLPLAAPTPKAEEEKGWFSCCNKGDQEGNTTPPPGRFDTREREERPMHLG